MRNELLRLSLLFLPARAATTKRSTRRPTRSSDLTHPGETLVCEQVWVGMGLITVRRQGDAVSEVTNKLESAIKRTKHD
ncbi:hypothetical protein BE221DRAFT_193242, partial [Ostreococcus tauri]